MRFVVFIFTILLLVSCSDLKKGEQLETISVLNKSIDSIQTVLIENKLEEINQLEYEVEAVISRIKDNISSDTLELSLATKIDTYQRMYHSLSFLKSSYSLLKSSLIEEKKVLRKLKKDIKKGNGYRNKYEEYVIFESAKVATLRSNLKKYVSLRKKSIDIHLSLHDKLYDFSFELITK